MAKAAGQKITTATAVATASLVRLLSCTPAADTAITRQAVTKHLDVLEEAGLVASSRIGRESRYSFRPEAIEEIRAYLDEVSRQWDEALGRLRSFVEG